MGDDELLYPEDEAEKLLGRGNHGKYLRFAMAALGVIPWIGGIIAATAALSAENEQNALNLTLQRWLQEHENKFRSLEESLIRVAQRVDALGDDAQQRLNDEEFLPLVRRAYRKWDEAQTEEKRRLFERLLTNAAGTRLVEDDVVRLFIDWIDRYDEAHFRIIKAVYRSPGISRLGIWRQTGGLGTLPRENSSEADLYRMLMHDLSTGRVLRQHRATDGAGRFLKKPVGGRRRGPTSPYTKSSFDETEPYELSELGQKFVHYVLSEAVDRIGGS